MLGLMLLNGRLLHGFSERRLLLVGCIVRDRAGLGGRRERRLGLAAFVPCFMALFGALGLRAGERDRARPARPRRDRRRGRGARRRLPVRDRRQRRAARGSGRRTALLGVVIACLAGAAATTAAVTIGSDRRRTRAATVVPV